MDVDKKIQPWNFRSAVKSLKKASGLKCWFIVVKKQDGRKLTICRSEDKISRTVFYVRSRKITPK
jgi:hypothetical protein